MAEESGPPVDPRFDPVFQRGYDPAVHAPVARRSALRAPAAVIPPAAAIPPMPVSAPDAPAVAAAADEIDEPEPEGRNPWLLALLLVSIGLLVVAGVFLWTVGQRNVYSSGTPDAAEIMLQQLAYMLPPGLIVAGMLGIMLRLALGAIRAERA